MTCNFKIITFGKNKERAYDELEKLFYTRVETFAKLKIINLPEERYHDETQMEAAKEEEARMIRRYLTTTGINILLDEAGKEYTSKELAQFIKTNSSRGEEIVFVIGSGAGLAQSIKKEVPHKVSLSRLTLPHSLARVVLAESLYRSCTFIKGIDYHK